MTTPKENFTISPQEHARLSRKLSDLEVAMSTFDVRVECLTNFQDFRDTARQIPHRKEITAVYDIRQCDIGPNNGFWIKASDEHGQLVHIQAMRFDDLNETSLSQHWLESPSMFAPAGYQVVLEKCNFDTAPASHRINGKVCYHGDFWLDASYRKLDLAPLLSKYSTLQALLKFEPDYIYGLVPPTLIERGWAARQGYLHMHPWAPRWYIEGQKEFYDDYLVWITGPELLSLWTAGERDIDVLSRINIAHNNGRSVAKYVRS